MPKKITIKKSFPSRASRARNDVLEGKICRWDNPTVYKDSLEDTKWKQRSSIGGVNLHPSQDIRCRCVGYSIIPEF